MRTSLRTRAAALATAALLMLAPLSVSLAEQDGGQDPPECPESSGALIQLDAQAWDPLVQAALLVATIGLL